MLKIVRISMVAVLGLVVASLMGCHQRYDEWQRTLVVGQSTAEDVQEAFKTPVEAGGDRSAFAIAEDKLNKDTILMMADLDEDGIVDAKYYWHWAPAPNLVLLRTNIWKMALETQISPSELQQYSPGPGPREEAILQYFGEKLFDTARHFNHIDEVFGATGSMTRILTMAAGKYHSRGDKQTLLSEEGFTFDAGIFANKATMFLETVDERQGLYRLVLQGYRTRNFARGW